MGADRHAHPTPTGATPAGLPGQPDTQAVLLQILEELRGIRAQLEPRQSAESDEAAARLLAAIWVEIGNRAFVSREIVAHAALPKSELLREAIIAARGTLNAKSLGKLLRRVEGRPLGGLSVNRLSEDRDGAIWEVRREVGV